MSTVNGEQGERRTEAQEADRLSTIIQTLMEERQQREAQMAEERTRREEEIARQQERHERDMQEKMDAMMRLVENVGKS